MRHWIEDSDCRDQYSVIYEAGERTAIFNNDAKDPIIAEERAVSRRSLFEMQGHIDVINPLRFACSTCNVFAPQCSAGQRRTCAGLLKAPIWPPSTSVVLRCGAARSSSRFRGSAIRVFPSSTSRHVKGNQECLLAVFFFFFNIATSLHL